METYQVRLTNVFNELYDLMEDAECFADDLQHDIEGDGEKYRSARGVHHKVQEAIGPLQRALESAEQGGL